MAIKELSNLQIKSGNTWYELCPFPVGFIYMSTNGTSPASTYGGSWSALTDSRFLRPQGKWNATGGNTTHYHMTPIGKHYGESNIYVVDDTELNFADSIVYQGVGGAMIKADELIYKGSSSKLRAVGTTATDSTPPLQNLLRLVPHCLIFTSWMEGSDNGNNAR